MQLFAHLPQYEREASLSAAAVAKGNIHPAILRLGLQANRPLSPPLSPTPHTTPRPQMAEGLIAGTNHRVIAMLRAFQSYITDFDCPPAKATRPLMACIQPARHLLGASSTRGGVAQVIGRELEGALKSQIQYIVDCRPQARA